MGAKERKSGRQDSIHISSHQWHLTHLQQMRELAVAVLNLRLEALTRLLQLLVAFEALERRASNELPGLCREAVDAVR